MIGDTETFGRYLKFTLAVDVVFFGKHQAFLGDNVLVRLLDVLADDQVDPTLGRLTKPRHKVFVGLNAIPNFKS